MEEEKKIEKNQDCPHCGRCPICGRRDVVSYQPWYPYPYTVYPWTPIDWDKPYYTWGDGTAGVEYTYIEHI